MSVYDTSNSQRIYPCMRHNAWQVAELVDLQNPPGHALSIHHVSSIFQTRRLFQLSGSLAEDSHISLNHTWPRIPTPYSSIWLTLNIEAIVRTGHKVPVFMYVFTPGERHASLLNEIPDFPIFLSKYRCLCDNMLYICASPVWIENTSSLHSQDISMPLPTYLYVAFVSLRILDTYVYSQDTCTTACAHSRICCLTAFFEFTAFKRRRRKDQTKTISQQQSSRKTQIYL